MQFLKRLQPVHCCALFAFVYLVVILHMNGYDPMAFVRLGGHFDPRAGGQAMGYDGQFGYQIALDPLHGWQYVDIPTYRYQRILFPIVVFFLSLGSAPAVPWLMLLVNYSAYLAGIWLLQEILAHFQKPRWFAIIYGMYVGVLMALRLDLTEPLAYFLVLAGIYFHIHTKTTASIASLALAVLAKEITILFLGAFALAEFFRNPRRGLLMGISGAAPYIMWKGIVFLWLGDWGLNSGGALAAPFEYIPYFGWWKTALYAPQFFLTVSLLIVPLVVLPSLAGLWLSLNRILLRHDPDESALMLFFTSLLIPFLPSSNIMDPLGVSRALIGVVIALVFFGAKQNNRRLLNYCLLFCITAVFIWRDTLVPVGNFMGSVPGNLRSIPCCHQQHADGSSSRGYIPVSCTRSEPVPLKEIRG
jgi:hypothetical protein